METKIQLRGHCQVCGRNQAVQRGTMAKHGYTVEKDGYFGGYFHGVCAGHNHRPLEEERKELDRQVKVIEGLIRDDEKLVRDLNSGATHPSGFDNGHSGIYKKFIPWAECTQHQKQRAKDMAIWKVEFRIRLGQSWIKDMLALAEKIHGQPVAEIKQEKKAGIEVGSQIKWNGKVYTVTKIEYRVARGVGPGINGQNVEHAFFMKDGREIAWPKRNLRLAK